MVEVSYYEIKTHDKICPNPKNLIQEKMSFGARQQNIPLQETLMNRS
jgi:hypothetical protein